MAESYLAQIDPSDYEMIRGVLNEDLPDTYEVWLKFQTKGEVEAKRQGHSIVYVPIDPDELVRYCGSNGGHRSRHGLHHFVIRKSRGENY